MKFYDSIGPNPRIVRMFMAEKGIEMPKQTVDLRGGENRAPEHLKRNPHGQMPALELDDGRFLSEITAICEYLEEKKPEPALIGHTAEQRAECRMWTRRVDLNICEPLANAEIIMPFHADKTLSSRSGRGRRERISSSFAAACCNSARAAVSSTACA